MNTEFEYSIKAYNDKITVKAMVIILVAALVIFFSGNFLYNNVFLAAKNLRKLSIQYDKLVHENMSLKEKVDNQSYELDIYSNQIRDYKEIVELLNQQNSYLQHTFKIFAADGKKPQNYRTASLSVSRAGLSRIKDFEYLGEWKGTAYTPSIEECGNDKGLTASGKAIVPGYSIAVDTKYWKFGQKFYIEGIGIVEAMDTGVAIKGKDRFDIALFDRKAAREFGIRKLKVWLVK